MEVRYQLRHSPAYADIHPGQALDSLSSLANRLRRPEIAHSPATTAADAVPSAVTGAHVRNQDHQAPGR